MLAAVFEGEGQMSVKDVPEPTLVSPSDVVIEVEACGICGSDLQMLSIPPTHPGVPGTIMGHEFVGRVVSVGSLATGVSVGQRVVVDPDPKCGHCRRCRTGQPSQCENVVALGHERDGGLARLAVAPSLSTFPISDAVPAELAAMTEPLACVLSGLRQAVPRAGESAVVYGAGPIGCLFTALLRLSGLSPIVVVEPIIERHEIASASGATNVVIPEQAEDAVRRLLPEGASVVIDAVGVALPEAIEVASPGGRIILFGMNDHARPVIPAVTITRKGLAIYGSFIASFSFPEAIGLVESGTLPLETLLTAVLPLARAAEGFDRLRKHEPGKIVLVP